VKFARLELAPEAEQEDSREKVHGHIEAPEAVRPRREDEEELFGDEDMLPPESTGEPAAAPAAEKKEEEG